MIRKFIILFSVGFLVSVLISCFSTQHYAIREIDFYGVELKNPTAADQNKNFERVSDTLQNALYFEVSAFGDYQYGQNRNNSFINRAYATSVPKELDNYILIDSLQLKLDSDIYFGEDTIAANTDLWNHPLFIDYKWDLDQHDKYDIGYSIKFGFVHSLYEDLVIPSKKYLIEVTCKTSDNFIIVEEIELYLII